MAAATSQDAAPAGDLMDGGWLDAGWVTLPAEALPGLPGEPRTGERRFVLLHPAHGIAILDLWSSVAALPELEVAASLDAELALAGFLRRHDPRLPVRRIYLAQAALPQLTEVVARAYAGAPPLELPEGWIDAVRGRLAEPQRPTSLAARRLPRLRMAGRYRLAAGIAALLTAGVVGLLAAGGHVGGQRAQPVAEATSAPATAATLTAAVPEAAPAEPARSPATPPLAASAGPPAAAEPPAAMPPDPARVAAVPAPAEPALSPATPPPAVSAGPPAARAAIVPPVAVEPLPAVTPDPARIAAAPASPATPQPAGNAGPPAASAATAPPPAWRPAPIMPPNPARTAEGPTYRPSAAPPRSTRQQPRAVRRAAPARYSQGRTPSSGGSFIRQQSLQYATGNGS